MKSPLNQYQWNAKTKLALALCTVLAMSGAAFAQDDKEQDKSKGGTGADSQTQTGTAGQSGQLSRTDGQFVRDAAKSGMMEIKMGKMGVQKAQNSQVKQFAQKLVDDHGKAQSELQQFASRKGINLPQPRDHGITGTDSSTSDSSAVGAPGSDSGTSTSSERQRSTGLGGTIISSDPGESDLKKLQGLSGTDFDREFVRVAVKHHQKNVQDFEQASKKVEDQELKAWIDKTLPTLKEHLQTAQSLQSTVGSAGAPGADSGTSSGTSSGNSSSGTGTSSGTPSTPDPSK